MHRLRIAGLYIPLLGIVVGIPFAAAAWMAFKEMEIAREGAGLVGPGAGSRFDREYDCQCLRC
jgi:hypothetical protein